MKLALACITLLLTAAPASAQYTSRCSRDYFGNLTCRTNINGHSSTTRTTRDYFGNIRSTYSDNYGNRSTCRLSTDYFGNSTVRCY